MSSQSDSSELSGIRQRQAENEEFWQRSAGPEYRRLPRAARSVRDAFLAAIAARNGRRNRITRPVIGIFATVALMFGLAGPASAAPDPVASAKAALARATEGRVAAENRLAQARSRLAVAETVLDQLGKADERLTQQLAEARETMREFAIAAYIDGGKSDMMRAAMSPAKAQALAWQSVLSAGQSTSADEVAREFEELKSRNTPKQIKAAEDLARAKQAMTDASNDAIQAAAFERDAEAALSVARRRAADEAAERRARQRAASEASSGEVRSVSLETSGSGSSKSAPSSRARATQPDTGGFSTAATKRGNPSAAESATLARIRRCESGGNYSIVSSSGRYRGAYQFDYRTWAGMGGSGDPAAASPAEQDYRALLLLRQRGTRPWPVCGR